MKTKLIPVLALCVMTALPANTTRCPFTMTMLALGAVTEVLVQMTPQFARNRVHPVRIVQGTLAFAVAGIYTWHYMKPCPKLSNKATDSEETNKG